MIGTYMNKENDNILKDELNEYYRIITRKKRRYGLLIIFSTVLLAISIINYNNMLILINVATIGLLMINRSCTFSYIRKNDIGEKVEFLVGLLIIIISFFC